MDTIVGYIGKKAEIKEEKLAEKVVVKDEEKKPETDEKKLKKASK